MNQLTSRINGLKRVSHGTRFGTRLRIADGIVMSKQYIPYNPVRWGTEVPSKCIASPAIDCGKGGLLVWMLGLEQEQIVEESGMALCRAVGVLPHGDEAAQDHLYRGP